MRILAATVLSLLLSCPGARAERVVSVAMDARDITDDAYRELGLVVLQRKLALRLTEAGYAVVSPKRSPSITLGLQVKERVLELVVGDQTRRVQRGDGTPEAFHLEAIHRAMAMVREAARTLPAPASRPAPTSRPTSAPVKPVKPPPVLIQPAPRPSTDDAWHLEFGLGAMALYRPGGVDPLARGTGRVGIGILRGLGLRGAVGLSPHFGDKLTVVDLLLQSGLSWRFALTPSLYLEPGVFVGVLQHIFHVDVEGKDWDLQWDFLGNVSFELGWRLHRYLAVRLWLSPGFGSRSLSHSVNGEEVYRRSLFRIEAGACGVLVIR